MTDLEKLINAGKTTGDYRPELPPVPQRMRSLPIRRGYPVPWFVAFVDGDYHFPTADGKKLLQAISQRLCWVCGKQRGAYLSFVVGPMCVVNRTTSEPPCHHECAVFSARACPFLSRPKMRRVDEEQHPDGSAPPAGNFIDRNPGVAVVYTTKNYGVLNVNDGILFRLGTPESVMWFAHSRAATREEAQESLSSGLPFLHKHAESEGPAALKELDRAYTEALRLLPE